MSSDPTPPPPNRFWPRRGESAGRSRIPPAVQRVILFLLAVAAVYVGLALKAGWFPFGDRNRLAAEVKADVAARANLHLDSVQITGQGQAVGTLPDGEQLVIRWKQDGDKVVTLCQRPKAEVEAGLRASIARQYGPVDTLVLRPSPAGVGYVGEAVLESGMIYDVFETTDLDEMSCHHWVWQSSKNYADYARQRFEKAFGEKVTATADTAAGDFPEKSPAGEFWLFTGRMRTASGLHAVELYQERPVNPDPNAVGGEIKVRFRKVGP